MAEFNDSLEGFGWGEGSPEPDFFSQDQTKEISTDPEEIIKEINKDDEDENQDDDKSTDTSKDKKVVKEDDFFAKSENDEDESDEHEEEEDDNKSIESPNVFVLNKLKEKGLIDFELEEGEELTEEFAEDLLEDKFDETVEERIKESMSDLPDESKQVIQFLIKGGNITELVKNIGVSNEAIDLEADLENEETQISVMKKLLRMEDFDDEEVEAQIEFLKESGKLKTLAEKKFNKYKKEVQDKKQEFLAEQEEKKRIEKENIRKAKTKWTSFLNENDEVDGIKITNNDKKALPSYMTEKTVKLNNGTHITQMQKELFYDVPGNEKAYLQLAALLRNRNEDGTFNFESIKKESQTKVAQKVKEELRRNKASIPGNSTKSKKQAPNKHLADYFST